MNIPVDKSIEGFYKYQETLLPYTGKYLGFRNLDIGCGSGITSVIHQQELNISPSLCDVIDARHELAQSLHFAFIQNGKLPFEDNSFDSSYVQFVLHHLPSTEVVENLLAEASRVSKRIIIVEEMILPHTNIARAKEFDEEVNDRINPGTSMPIYQYYSEAEIERFLNKINRKIIFHIISDKGSEDNGFLETHIFVAD